MPRIERGSEKLQSSSSTCVARDRERERSGATASAVHRVHHPRLLPTARRRGAAALRPVVVHASVGTSRASCPLRRLQAALRTGKGITLSFAIMGCSPWSERMQAPLARRCRLCSPSKPFIPVVVREARGAPHVPAYIGSLTHPRRCRVMSASTLSRAYLSASVSSSRILLDGSM